MKKKNGILEGIERETAKQTAWQLKHQKEDTAQFNKIAKAILALPNRDDIIRVVGDAVDIKINGKLISIKEHLNQQDEIMNIAAVERAEMQKTLIDLNNKIRPIDSVRSWANDFARAVLYVGALAAAIAAIIYLFNLVQL